MRGDLAESQRGLGETQRAAGEADEWRKAAAAERRGRAEDRDKAKAALELDRKERDAREARLFSEAAQARAGLEHACVQVECLRPDDHHREETRGGLLAVARNGHPHVDATCDVHMTVDR